MYLKAYTTVFLSYYKFVLKKHHKTHIINEIKAKTVKLIDSSTISLCLSMFEWAKYRTAKGGIKLHTCFDIDTMLPEVVSITEAKVHDRYVLEQLIFPKDTVIVEDRSYFDFTLMLNRIYVANDIVFISEEKREELKVFAENNRIALIEHSWNWDWILAPYLDTEFTIEKEQQALDRLIENGFEKQEIDQIRAEVGKQMYKYNAVLWECRSLGLYDVKRVIAIDKRSV